VALFQKLYLPSATLTRIGTSIRCS